MRLDWAIPCTSVTIEGDGPPSRMENFGFDSVWVASLPTTVEFIVLARAAGLPGDFVGEADRMVDVKLSGPGMEDVMEMQFELPSGEAGPEHQEGWEINVMVPILIQFTPYAEGPHIINFHIGGRVQRCPVPLVVRIGEPAA